MKSIFEEQAEKLGILVAEKNAAYGSAFSQAHQILKVLFPNGIRPDQYTDVLAIVRVLDKFFRIANRKNAFGENPWQDIAGYALLGIVDGIRKDSEPKPLPPDNHKTVVVPTKKAKKRKQNK